MARSSEGRRILKKQACFRDVGNKPVMMTDHCESVFYVEGAKSMKVLRCLRCLRWGAKSVMCCNVYVEIATSSVMLQCL